MSVANQTFIPKKSKLDGLETPKINWMVGKRLNLPVCMMKPPDKQYSIPQCYLEVVKGKQKSFVPFNPKEDWRITGTIINESPITIIQEKRNLCTTTNITVKIVDNKGNDIEISSTYDLAGCICKAYICYIEESEVLKLVEEANKIYDELRGFKTSGK